MTATAEDIVAGRLTGALAADSPTVLAMVDFMADYYRCWNAKDAEALASRIYRLGPSGRLHTAADFKTLLAELVADGWDYSTLKDVEVFPWGDDGVWLVRGLFNRFAADGALLQPADRVTGYVVTEFPDGPRITDLPLVYGR